MRIYFPTSSYLMGGKTSPSFIHILQPDLPSAAAKRVMKGSEASWSGRFSTNVMLDGGSPHGRNRHLRNL